MGSSDATARKSGSPAPGRIGVVDIGSNTVRLVVYDAPTRLPFPLFNEKAQCELGRGLNKNGRLNPEGVDLALRSLGRFLRLASAMGVEELQLVATAAVREASDGPDFVQRVETSFGHPVQVVSGAEEARLSALGLLSGVPEADGLLGDLGGGSLDLVVLDQGRFGDNASLPLGHLRLAEFGSARSKKVTKAVAESLDGVPWLDTLRGRTFYAAGGSWRAIARVVIEQTKYPLHLIDGYAIDGARAVNLVELVSRLSPDTIRKMPGIARRRGETLPQAAVALAALLKRIEPNRLVFSAFGMREGKMLQCLPDDLRHQDPLISGCLSLAERERRFTVDGDEIVAWMGGLFPEATPRERRMLRAAALLSDIGWSEHPDYRANHVFHRALRLPFAGLTHRDRVWLAIALYVRYNGAPDDSFVKAERALLDDAETAYATGAGLALRLAHTLSGSAPGLLERTRLERSADTLSLVLPKERAVFESEAVERRFNTLARIMGLAPHLA